MLLNKDKHEIFTKAWYKTLKGRDFAKISRDTHALFKDEPKYRNLTYETKQALIRANRHAVTMGKHYKSIGHD